jgi:hypothetical protein
MIYTGHGLGGGAKHELLIDQVGFKSSIVIPEAANREISAQTVLIKILQAL